MKFIFHDGDRAAAGYKGSASDCVTRAIAIATEKPYQEVYDALNLLGRPERRSKRKRSDSRAGVHRATHQRYLAALGWRWTSTMSIGYRKPSGWHSTWRLPNAISWVAGTTENSERKLELMKIAGEVLPSAKPTRTVIAKAA